MSNTESHQLSILISTCDRYSDAWPPFFELFDRFWPNCPLPIYMMSNGERLVRDDVTWIPIDPALDWSSSLLSALESIPSRWVLLLLEDYFLSRPVDTERLLSAFNDQVVEGWSCLRLFPVPPGNRSIPGRDEYRLIENSAKYSVSTQVSIWDRRFLQSLIVPGESGWEFEDRGSQRLSERKEIVVSLREVDGWAYPISYYCTAIVTGKWEPDALEMCRRFGVEVDTSRRRVRDWRDRLMESRWVRRLARVSRRLWGSK